MPQPSTTSVTVRHFASRWKEACIIAAGKWGGKRALLKNRDRNYNTKIWVVHEILDGVEVLYIKDDITGWVEGLNEFGIGVVNTALQVVRDEAEKRVVKTVGKKSKDGPRILNILKRKSLQDALDVACSYKGGIRGHTFISDRDTTMSVEATKKHECVVRRMRKDKIHVRTNHGFHYDDAGYTDGDDYLSSVSRRNQAMRCLRDIESIDEIAPHLLKKSKSKGFDQHSMVRDTDNMRTTTQMVLDLNDLVLKLYLIPGKSVLKGVKNKLPKGYEPKICFQVFKYSELQNDGEVQAHRVKTAKSFKVEVGDPILYGKYLNKRGIVKGFKTGPKGDPIVVIEQVPNPTGRKQDKEVKLFRIRYDKERLGQVNRQASKEPWMMTLEEFFESGIQRSKKKPVMSFDQWLRQKGVNPRDVATEYEEADFIGETLFGRPNMTRREKGKWKRLARRVENRNRLYAQYNREISRKTVKWDIDKASRADVAYVRSQHKRAIRRALHRGLSVPSEVLAEYPEIRVASRWMQKTGFDGYPYKPGQHVMVGPYSPGEYKPGVIRGRPDLRETLDDKVLVRIEGEGIEWVDPDSIIAEDEQSDGNT